MDPWSVIEKREARTVNSIEMAQEWGSYGLFWGKEMDDVEVIHPKNL